MVIGSSNTDMTVVTRRHPAPGETVLGGHFRMGAGGKGANQAVAAKRLGGDVSFICKVGSDLFGDNSVEHYRQEGLDVSDVIRSSEASGIALITVDESGENSIVVASGANADMTVADTVIRAAEIAHDSGVYVVLNPAPACDLPAGLYDCTSLIIPNYSEMKLLTGIEPSDETSAAQACNILHSKGVGDIILTAGAHGCIVSQEGKGLVRMPAMQVKAVDTTGAGDTFCGALCVALAEGRTLVEAAGFATCASALSVQKYGAQASVPYRSEVERIYAARHDGSGF